MGNAIDIPIPIDQMHEAALQSTARRAAAGRVIGGLLSGVSVRDILAEAIKEAKIEARASDLSDDAIDQELQVWHASRTQ